MSNEQNENKTSKPVTLSFWEELQHRKVTRVASVYIITGWLIIQVAAAIFPNFGIPDWAFRFITLVIILGFPVALILAWAFELTPEGIKVTRKSEINKPLESDNTKRNWHAYALGALLPTIVFGALAMFFYVQTDNPVDENESDVAQNVVVTPSIAMMPLINMSSNADNAHFAGGIHEDVLTNLSRIKDLQVISRTSMLRYAALNMTLKEIGQKLKVDYIVEGSVRRVANHVRVTIQLINAQNDLHMWANNFDRELVDIFATQSELAKEISDSLHLEIKPESVGELEGMPTFSVKAYDLYTRAISLEKTKGANEENTMRRRLMLEEAVLIDPNFVEAWAVLKRVYDYQASRISQSGWFEEQQDRDEIIIALAEKSKRALNTAQALAPENPEVLLSLAVDHIWPKTKEEMQIQKALLDKVIAINPHHAKAYYHLGWWHSHRRDLSVQNTTEIYTDAAEAFEESLKLDPFNARMLSAVTKWYKDRGNQKELDRLAKRLIQILPETAQDRSLMRISWYARRDQIIAAFLDTADESFISQYQNFMEESALQNEFPDEYMNNWEEMRLAIFKNDEKKIIEISQLPFELKEEGWNPTLFQLINATAMMVYINQGDIEQARITAQKLIDNQHIILSTFVGKCDCTPGILAISYAILGDKERAKQVLEELQGKYKLDVDRNIRAWSFINIDQAIEMAFNDKAKFPKWHGFDDMAA